MSGYVNYIIIIYFKIYLILYRKKMNQTSKHFQLLQSSSYQILDNKMKKLIVF